MNDLEKPAEPCFTHSFVGQNTKELRLTTFSSDPIGAWTIVTLKTGGPAMVVSERTTDKAHCLWHQEDGDMVAMWINIVCLKVRS